MKVLLFHLKRVPRPVGLLIVLFLCFMTYGCENKEPADNPQFNEIKRLWTGIPLYPGMVEVNRFASWGRVARISKQFTSEVPCDEVKRFYMQKLTEGGWQFAQEEQLTDWGRDKGVSELKFQKADYHLNVTCTSKKANYGWDYSIGVEQYDK